MDPAEATGEYIGVTLIEREAAADLADALQDHLRARPRPVLRGRLPGAGEPRLPHRRGPDRRRQVGRDRQPRRPREGPGDRVPVLTRLIPSPVVVDIRRGALDDLAGLLADQRISASGQARLRGQRRLGRGPARAARPAAARRRLVRGRRRHHRRRGHSWPTTSRPGGYDAVVGLGGGKIIDVAKYAAARVGLPLVAVATNLAHDGICSPVVHPGQRRRAAAPTACRTPIAIVIDLDVIREAPDRFVRSGIGDAISNISAIADWELSHRGQRRGDRRPGRRDGPHGRRGRAAPPRRRRRRRLPEVLAEGARPLRHRDVDQRRHPARRPAPATRSATPSTCSSRKRAARHGEQVGLGAAFAMHLRGAARGVRSLRRRAAPARPARYCRRTSASPWTSSSGPSRTHRRPAPDATRSWSTSTCPPTRSRTLTPTMPKPSVAELRPVVHPAGRQGPAQR